TGPAPLGGAADLVLVAEELVVGLGAGLAGLPSLDPGANVSAPPAAKIEVARHPTALRTMAAPQDRTAFVRRARVLWPGAVLWPAAAGDLLAELVALHDLRVLIPLDLVVGAPSPFLAGFPIRARSA